MITWTERMQTSLRERSRRLNPKNYPGGQPPDVVAWRAEVDRVYDALEWLTLRRLQSAFRAVAFKVASFAGPPVMREILDDSPNVFGG